MFLDEFGADFSDVCLFTEVRWMSRANCLARFFELRHEIKIFFQVNKVSDELYSSSFGKKEFLEELAFLTDITRVFNSVYLSLQGKQKVIFDIVSHLNSFKNTLKLLKADLSSTLMQFRCCKIIKEEIENATFERFTANVDLILSQVDKRFNDFKYIESLADIYFFPLICTVQHQPIQFQDELVKLQSDFTFNRFDINRGIQFWSNISKNGYPILTTEMMRICSMFPTTYQCEAAFSTMKRIKDAR